LFFDQLGGVFDQPIHELEGDVITTCSQLGLEGDGDRRALPAVFFRLYRQRQVGTADDQQVGFLKGEADRGLADGCLNPCLDLDFDAFAIQVGGCQCLRVGEHGAADMPFRGAEGDTLPGVEE